MNKNAKILVAALIALGLGSGWYFTHRGAAEAPAGAEKPADASVLVTTVALQKRPLAETLNAYGDVTPGKTEALSFAGAGQLAQLLVVPGQSVRRGAALAILAADPTAQATYAQAQTALDFSQHEMQRIADLSSLQLATASQADAAKKALQDAQAALAAQKKLGAGGSVALAAPFDGVVVAISAAQGDRLQAGAAVMQLGRTATLRVQLGIDPAQARRVRVGQAVTLALLQDPQQTVSAHIALIQPVLDPKTQLFNALVDLPAAANSTLMPGMHVQATIVLGAHPASVVPRTAVLTDDKGAYLFQVAAGKARRVNLGKTREDRNDTGVEGPLDPALPVIVSGNYELSEGMAVRQAKP